MNRPQRPNRLEQILSLLGAFSQMDQQQAQTQSLQQQTEQGGQMFPEQLAALQGQNQMMPDQQEMMKLKIQEMMQGMSPEMQDLRMQGMRSQVGAPQLEAQGRAAQGAYYAGDSDIAKKILMRAGMLTPEDLVKQETPEQAQIRQSLMQAVQQRGGH